MLISSDKKTSFKKVIEISNENKPYVQTIIIGICVFLLCLYPDISWGIGFLIFSLVLIGLTFFLNIKLEYFSFSLIKYFIVILILFIISSPIHIIPMIIDYQKSERINIDLPINDEVKLNYNDNSYAFILYLGKEKQPLMFSVTSESYNKLKADLLDGKIKVCKKKIKNWYDTTAFEGYFLGQNKFN